MIVDRLEPKWGTEIHLRPSPGAAALIIVWNTNQYPTWRWRRLEDSRTSGWLGQDTNMFIALEKAMVAYEKILKGEKP